MGSRLLIPVTLLTLFTALPADAQKPGGADSQLRLLLHKQLMVNSSHWGLAGWWVFPDVTVAGNRLRSLIVAGPIFRDSSRWIELMAGVMAHENRDDEWLVNLRVSDWSFAGMNLMADLECFPNAERLYWWVGGDRRFLGIGTTVLRIGIESENISFLDDRQDLYGIGPRISLVTRQSIVLATAYQFRNDRDFLRIYILYAREAPTGPSPSTVSIRTVADTSADMSREGSMGAHDRDTTRRPGTSVRSGRLRLLVTAAALAGCATGEPSDRTQIRIGWQVPWATQGQIVQVLKHTNVLDMYGLTGEFKGFSYGAPLNEAALAGEVDVIFTADQPAAALLAGGGQWKIVSRLMYNRVALYVPPESPIREIADLRGKTIAMPLGAAAQREALKAIRAVGLDPDRDVRTVNLDIYEQAGVIQAGTRESWGQIDALAGFDPAAANFEHQGLARMLNVTSVVSVVLMSADFVTLKPEAAKDFLKAYVSAYYYYAAHPDEVGDWFLNESRLQLDPQVLEVAASVEPNLRARTLMDIDVRLTPELFRRLQEAADFNAVHGLAKRRVTMREHIDLTFLEKALTELAEERDRVADVHPVTPGPR